MGQTRFQLEAETPGTSHLAQGYPGPDGSLNPPLRYKLTLELTEPHRFIVSFSLIDIRRRISLDLALLCNRPPPFHRDAHLSTDKAIKERVY